RPVPADVGTQVGTARRPTRRRLRRRPHPAAGVGPARERRAGRPRGRPHRGRVAHDRRSRRHRPRPRRRVRRVGDPGRPQPPVRGPARRGGPDAGRGAPGRVPVPLGPALDRRRARRDRRGARAVVQRARRVRGRPGVLRPTGRRGLEGPRSADDDVRRGRAVSAPLPGSVPGGSGRKPLPATARPATLAVRGGHARTDFQETSEALFLTQGYTYDRAADAEAAFKGELDRFVYSRYGNPTVHTFEERLRLLEGAEACYATATGMSAVFTSLAALVGSGSRIVAARALFGSTVVIFEEILKKWGVRTDYADGHVLTQWEEALSTPADVVFFETPSNPMQDIVDVRAVVDLAHAAGATVVLDNVFATPLLQKPLELGADVVVYSATKHIDGQGRVLGGAILGSTEYVTGPVQTFIRNTGPSLSPFNAWTLLK